MLRVVFSGESRKRPVDKFFKAPLIEAQVKAEFCAAEDKLPDFDDGDIVLACGMKVLELYREAGLVKKNLSVTKMRNQMHELVIEGKTIKTFFSFDPLLALMEPSREPDIQWDIRYVLRYIKTGSPDPVLGDYQYVTDFNTNILDIMAATKPLLVCLDLETIGLDEFAPEARIVTVQVTTQVGKTSVYRVPESGIIPKDVADQIHAICTHKMVKLTGANLKFDQRWIMRHLKIWITNQTFDTNLVGALMNENRGNSLNLHAKLYTDLGGYDDEFERNHDKSRMDIAIVDDPKGFLQYSGGDTDACLRVTNHMRKDLLKDKKLTNFYVKLLQPAAKAFAMMEHRGIIVDHNRYEELKVEVTEHMQAVEKKVFGMMGNRLKLRYSEKLRLSVPDLLRDHMFDRLLGLGLEPQMETPSGQVSTAMEHLEMFSDVPEAAEFVSAMKEYNSAKKTLSTYVIGFMKHIRSDGRFHPAFRMYKGDFGSGKEEGAATGRTSATAPAVQTIPKHTMWSDPLRSVYVPPEGMAILKLDYSQGELKITACVANETNMIQTYNSGIDLHMRTGALVVGVTLEEALALKANKDPMAKKIRQGGKAGNFGNLYGISAEGFQTFARNTYGVHMSIKECEDFQTAFFKEYPRIQAWQQESKDYAHEHMGIRSPLGRIRHLPLINSRDRKLMASAERMSVNSPIQCTLSDFGLLAAAELHERYPDLWLFNFVHDELAFYVPEDHVQGWAIKIAEVMENLPIEELFGWKMQLQMTVDAEYSVTNMAECKEMELAA